MKLYRYLTLVDSLFDIMVYNTLSRKGDIKKLAVFLTITVTVPVLATNQEDFLPKNTTMYSLYSKLVNQSSYKGVLENNLYDKLKHNYHDILIESEGIKDINNFKEILKSSSAEVKTSLVKEEQSKSSTAIIMNEERSNAKLYYEWSDYNSPVLLIVNSEKYNIIQDGQKIYIVSEGGDKLLISETYYDRAVYVDERFNSLTRASHLKDTVYTLSNDKAYSKDIGPMSTTNKSLLEAVGLIGAGAGSKIKAIHPILGAITYIAAGISVIGFFYQTFYIRFWRSHQLNTVGGLTRNKERWFSEIGCSNSSHIKNHTAYFNGTRPPY